MGYEFLEKCCLCSLCWIFAGRPPGEEGACHPCQTEALQHWDFGTSRISFSPHIQTKGFRQRPPPERSLKLASCQTRPVASLFWQRFCSYPKFVFLGGGVKTYGVAGISVGVGKRMVENCVPWYCWHNWERGGKRIVQRGGGETYQNFGLRKSKSGPIQNPQQSSPLLAQNSVLPLGGCGDDLVAPCG